MAFSVFQCPGKIRQDMHQPNHKLYNLKERLILVFDGKLVCKIIKGLNTLLCDKIDVSSIRVLYRYFRWGMAGESISENAKY